MTVILPMNDIIIKPINGFISIFSSLARILIMNKINKNKNELELLADLTQYFQKSVDD